VDIFRRSEEVPAIVREVIESGQRPVIWMQEGVISEEAKNLAEAAGMKVIMNACLMKTQKANELEKLIWG
jgi:predicted CoA-binding protein